jgi:hypothetical protein
MTILTSFKVSYLPLKRTVQQKWIWLKFVSIGRSFLKGEVQRISVYFLHPLPHERPFKVLCLLIQALGTGKITALLDINIHNAV